jgi:hypothetical protein
MRFAHYLVTRRYLLSHPHFRGPVYIILMLPFITTRFSSDMKADNSLALPLLDSEGEIGGDWKGNMQRATRDAQVGGLKPCLATFTKNGVCAV